MKQEYKQPWIDALRSGDYKQGKTHLHSDSKFCCLGVLCEINPAVATKTMSLLDFYARYDGDSAQLTSNLREEFDISETDMDRLMTKNDSDGKSFSEIADWIEQNL